MCVCVQERVSGCMLEFVCSCMYVCFEPSVNLCACMCVHKSCVFMHKVKTCLCVSPLISPCSTDVDIHSTELSYLNFAHVTHQCQQVEVHNAYTDQMWTTSWTFTCAIWHQDKLCQSQPCHTVFPPPFSHFTSARGKDTSFQWLNREQRDLFLCLFEEMTHPGHATHFSFKEIGSYTAWISIFIHWFMLRPLAFYEGYISFQLKG